MSVRGGRGRFTFFGAALVAALAGLLGGLVVATPAFADEDDPLAPVLIQFEKQTLGTTPPTPFAPGSVVNFEFTVSCSSLDTDCVGLTVSDVIPDPLVLQSVSFLDASAPLDPAVITGNSFTIAANEDLGGGRSGLVAGRVVSFTATTAVPSDVSADWDGQTIVNTAQVSVQNRDTSASDSSDLSLVVPRTTGVLLEKTFTPGVLPALAGRASTIELRATNTSNGSVTSMVVQDPVTPGDAFDHLDITSLAVTMPSGANRVQVDWWGSSNGIAAPSWHTGSAQATATLPTVAAPGRIEGLRFTFTNSTGGRIARAAVADVDLGVRLRSSVEGSSSAMTLDNEATATVVSGGDQASDTDAASLVVEPAEVAPQLVKLFTPADVIGGRSTEVQLTATNDGDFDLRRMTIAEPDACTASLPDQGIAFTDWTSGIEAPAGADEVWVRYRYADAPIDAGACLPEYAAAEQGTDTETLPAPEAGREVVGFEVEFRDTSGAAIQPGESAVIEFDAATEATATDAATVDTARLSVATVGGEVAETTATAPLVRRSARVETEIEKTFSTDWIYGLPGASTLVSLRAEVAPPPGAAGDPGSTIGSQSLVVSDPPAPDGTPSPFWNAFDAGAIVATEVPAGTLLTISWWNGTTWMPFSWATDVAGPTFVSRALTPTERGAVEGLQFAYRASDPDELLAPGFNVLPRFSAVLRDDLREPDGAATDTAALAAGGTEASPVEVPNSAAVVVANPDASPAVVTATDGDSVGLVEVDPGAGGIDLLEKEWLPVPANSGTVVKARSEEQATARLHWGTGGVGFDTVTISDTADDPATTDVEDTVFEAFDLVAIGAISPASDPLIAYDKVRAVELFIPGTGWTPTETALCVGAAACDGSFPGYVLSDDERRDATGVRLVLVESPTRAARVSASDPGAPAVGSGVASSFGRDRTVDLVFQVRDERRSAPGTPVLGRERQAIYNGGEGLVDNTARVVGRDTSGTVIATTDDDAQITIVDTTINVTAAKTWLDGPVGTPADGTPAELFPSTRVQLTATNISASRVDLLGLTEPTPSPNVGEIWDTFEYFTLTEVVGISVPGGADPDLSRVVLTGTGTYAPSYTIAEARALSATELAGVTGIDVQHEGRIAAGATTVVELDLQLREFRRSAPSTRVGTMNIDNWMTARVVDPGGVTAPTSPATENTATDTATDDMDVVTQSYGIVATKRIAPPTGDGSSPSSGTMPAVQYEGASVQATVTLTGRPTGNVRSTEMVLEDADPSFWNVHDLQSLPNGSLAGPIDQVRVDALVGVDYEVTATGGTPARSVVALCAGDTDLSDCWETGEFGPTHELPDGVAAADVRGLRFTYSRADGAAWERPYTPLQSVSFVVARRAELVEPAGEDVPSTLYTFTAPSPGETEIGTTVNTISATSRAVPVGSTSASWSATTTAEAAIQYRHRPAEVSIVTGPSGPLVLGAQVPYTITVDNLGTGQDENLGGVRIVGTVPTDGSGPLLRLPRDPDTDLPLAPSSVFSVKLTSGSTSLPAPAMTVTADNPAAPTAFTFTFPPGFTLGRGQQLVISAPLDFRDYLIAETVVYTGATLHADQPFDACTYTEIEGPVDALVTTTTTDDFVPDCTATTTVWPLPTAPMTITKGVRGVDAGPLVGGVATHDDLGILKTVTSSPVDCADTSGLLVVDGEQYYRYPCVPITRPGSTEEWAARFTNSGNIPVDKVVAIDVLPNANDKGVIINAARGSKWRPTLSTLPELSGAPAGAVFDVFYTTNIAMVAPRCNGADIQATMGMDADSTPAMLPSYLECLDDTAAPDDVPSRNLGWLPLTQGAIDAAPALLASAVALKFVIDMDDALPLAPASSIGIIYRSITADEVAIPEIDANLGRDSIAYNSIAGAAVGVEGLDDVPYRFVVEPRKVGVALATGVLELRKQVTGAGDAFAPGSFDVTLSCESADGDPISLRHADGSPRSTFTLDEDGTVVTVLGVPLYAECAVVEGDYGQTTAPAPVTIVSRASHTVDPKVTSPQPAYAARDAIERATLVNDYALAGFSVSKTVETTARDNAGTAIAYDTTTFTAVCTFDNGVGTAATVLDEDFTLADGESAEFDGLPARSECTVTETDRQGAAETQLDVVTAEGSATPVVVGSAPATAAASFTLTADEEPSGDRTTTVDVTNRYLSGSLDVQKIVAGLAAAQYATGRSYTVNVTCTLPDAKPDTVWSGPLTFTATTSGAATYTQTLADLALGASCSAAEPDTQGGSRSISAARTVSTPKGLPLTVTNTYNYAGLVVSKTVDSATTTAGVPVPNGPYRIEVTCTLAGTPVYADGYSASPMVLAVSHGTPVTLTGLPALANCAISETDRLGADSTRVTRTVNTTVTNTNFTFGGTPPAVPSTTITSLAANIGATVRNSVAFTNQFDVTSLTIVKNLEGGAVIHSGVDEVEVDVRCTVDSGGSTQVLVDERITLTLADSDGDGAPDTGSHTFDSLADGTECVVFEVDVDDTGADGWRLSDDEGNAVSGTDGPDTDPITVVSTVGDPRTVTLENWFLTGAVEVTKQVTGTAAADFGDGPFVVRLECELNGAPVDVDDPDRSFPESDASPWTTRFETLPSGADCTLTETARAGATTSTITGPLGTETVPDGYTFRVAVDGGDLTDDQAQSALTVVNDFPDATLVITKDVSSTARDQDGDALDYGEFAISAECTFQGAPVQADGYSSSPMSENLSDGESWSLTGLAAGTRCEIVEDDPKGADVTIGATSGTSAFVDLTSGDNRVTVVNEFGSAEIQLAKNVTGAGRAEWGQGTFRIDVECDLDLGLTDLAVWRAQYEFEDGDAPLLLAGLAAGADCTITEARTAGANATTVTVDTVATAGTAAGLVIVDGARHEVEVENRFDETALTVTKTVIDPSGLYGAGPYEVTLSCERDVDGTAESFRAVRSLDSTTTPAFQAVFDGLPRDAVCELEETAVGGAHRSTVTPASAFVLDDPAMSATVTNTFDTTDLRVQLTPIGPGQPLYGEGPFVVQVTCTWDVNGTEVELPIPGGARRTLTAADGYRAEFAPLPVGAECEVEQLKRAGANEVQIPIGLATLALGSTAELEVVDVFNLGAIEITKQLAGGRAAGRENEIFEMELVCTRDVDGVVTTVPVPGGAIRTVSAGETVRYEDLPEGARCVLNEVENGGADLTALMAATPLVPLPVPMPLVIADTTVEYTLVNVFLPSLAVTGSETGDVALLAVLLGLTGAVLLFASRRRRPAHRGGRLRL